MSNHLAQRNARRRQGKALLIGVASAALLAVAAFAAYRLLFDRPGEAAAMLLPSDVDLVVTLDTNPSERQRATFEAIGKALEREGIADKFDETLTGFLEGKPLGQEIRQRLSRSFAMGMWMREGSDPEVVTLCAIDDPAAVRASLEKHGSARSGGVFVLPGTGDQAFAAVYDGFLAISNSDAALGRVESVRAGKSGSVARDADFNAARAALPKDANLMVFVSPRMVKSFEKQFAQLGGGGAFRGTNWMAYSATVEPQGVAFDYHCPMDPSKAPALKALSGLRPLNLDALSGLPQGAYGVMGYSQSGRYWQMLVDAMGEAPESSRAFEEGVRQFEAESGLTVEKDIVPAFQGEQLFAVYPGESGDPEDLDVLFAATDSNGANPAALAKKVRALVERKSAEHGKGARFVESKIGDVSVWEIDPETRSQIVDGFSQGGRAETAGERGFPQADDLQPSPLAREAQPPRRSASPFAGKTVIYAQVGDSVIVCSSRAMLSRTLDVRNGGKSLADEAAFSSMKAHLVSDSQAVLMVNLKRIMEALRPVIESGLKDAPVKAEDVIGLFGDGLTGLVISGKMEGNVAIGRLLLPLDFDRLIAIAGSAMRASGELEVPEVR